MTYIIKYNNSIILLYFYGAKNENVSIHNIVRGILKMCKRFILIVIRLQIVPILPAIRVPVKIANSGIISYKRHIISFNLKTNCIFRFMKTLFSRE